MTIEKQNQINLECHPDDDAMTAWDTVIGLILFPVLLLVAGLITLAVYLVSLRNQWRDRVKAQKVLRLERCWEKEDGR